MKYFSVIIAIIILVLGMYSQLVYAREKVEATQMEKQKYNELVREYNLNISTFPVNLMAEKLGFIAKSYL